MHYLYVKLPVGPHSERGEQAFHEGLDAALSGARIGSVLGWGASLAPSTSPGPQRTSAQAAFHRIDIEAAHPDSALELLRGRLVALGAPAGTELHYALDGADWQDVLTEAGWSGRLPCTATPLHRRIPDAR